MVFMKGNTEFMKLNNPFLAHVPIFIRSNGKKTTSLSVEVLRCFSHSRLGPWGPGGAEHVGHVPVFPVGHCVVVGCDLVAHGGLPGVGAGGGQNYGEAQMVSDATSTGSLAQVLLR